MTPRRRRRRVLRKRYLARIEPEHHVALEAALRAAVVAWDADGWAIVGRPPHLRIAVLVRRKLDRPPHPATVIDLPAALGGGALDVEVLATHDVPEQAGLLPGAGRTFLAPGAPIDYIAHYDMNFTTAPTRAQFLEKVTRAFETLGCVRVELKTDARNERSRGAMARLPAQFEGIMRKHQITPDVGQRDSAYFSVIDDEWPTVRAALEARLS